MEVYDYNYIRRFYSNEEVAKEIIDYCKDRWVALEGKRGSKRIFIRYDRLDNPLKIDDISDLKRVFILYENLRPRTIYASINVYKILSKDKLKDPDNIIYSTPIWDIDGNLEDFDIIMKVAEIIVSELERFGIEKSIYLKWSGRGLHIHLHEKSISEKVRKKYHPLDISYAIVEYILKRKAEEISKEIKKARGTYRPFKVENKIDIQRVFTAPLSFHRELNYVCVCFKPNQLNEFTLEWAEPKKYKHNPKWREYVEGEADVLAEMAIKEIGGYLKKYLEHRLSYTTTSSSMPRKTEPSRKIGRFQVMALLQAARYYKLKGNIDKAKSFGLNRAIFYAWAKYYRPKYGVSRKTFVKVILGKEDKEELYEDVGDERAFLSRRGWFQIGDREQTPMDYDRQIAEKINRVVPYEKAWKAALKYIEKFPKDVLESQRKFYELVYKPVRDNFEDIIRKYSEE